MPSGFERRATIAGQVVAYGPVVNEKSAAIVGQTTTYSAHDGAG
jgi:hypothetical protein